ncbi:unnamed protein product [Leuciscus chuanchicus]
MIHGTMETQLAASCRTYGDERLCLDRCPRWRCNHSLYSAGVSFTGTRWRNPVCVYLDQPDTVITVPEQHVKSDLRSVLHPDLH